MRIRRGKSRDGGEVLSCITDHPRRRSAGMPKSRLLRDNHIPTQIAVWLGFLGVSSVDVLQG
jgi:hypothetical protein